jgi:hypothetical protein
MYKKETFTSQPQQSVGINWSNPLSEGLVAASIAGGSAGDLTVYTAPNGFSTGVGAAGIEAVTTVASTQHWQTTGETRIKSAPFTVLAVIRPSAFLNQAVFTAYASGNEYQELMLTNSGGAHFVSAVGAGTSTATATSLYTAGETFAIGGRVSPGDRSVWKNGVRRGTNGGWRTPVAALSNRWGLWTGTTERFGGGWYLRLAWDRALSDAEMAEIGRNPWQLFRPTPRPIFTPTGDSGVLIPDLTSPGVIDITANTAKPELNVQY